MKTNEKFTELLNTPEVKFTIILGSGFHMQALGGDSILSSWDILLRKVSHEANLTGQYHLDFEKIIQSKKITCEDSHVTEERLIACVQKLIKEEQERVLTECEHCYPLGIFNPEKVSDVISLNFDEVPEKLLKKEQNASKLSKFKNDSSFNKESNESYAFLSTRNRSVEFANNKTIKFWYPHGAIDNPKSIVLGLHRYACMVENGQRIRNHHMSAKRNNSTDNTWYYRLLENPVLILGAGMSPTEWDMWFALTSRERANNKTQLIFQMRECECKKDVQHEWFEPLFTGMSFDEQWKKLEELLKTK
jgi:hypothetical protein